MGREEENGVTDDSNVYTTMLQSRKLPHAMVKSTVRGSNKDLSNNQCCKNYHLSDGGGGGDGTP